MFDESSKSVWYGYIVSSKAKTRVIYDSALSGAPNGQIYFYNVDKDVISKFVKDLVITKLQDMTAKEQSETEKEIGKSWEKARKAFIDEHEKVFATKGTRVAKVAAPVDTMDDIDDLPAFDDDDTLDWDDE